MTTTFRLEIPADFGDGATTGVFEQFRNPREQDQVRTGFLLENVGDPALGFILGLLDDDENTRKGIFIDVGGGNRAINIRADVPGGEVTDDAGTTLQWGDDPDPGVLDRHTATGGTARQKKDVFMHYMGAAGSSIDSLEPATLHYGEYSSDGEFDPLEVVIEEPQFSRDGATDGDQFECDLTFIETVALQDALDGAQQVIG